MQTFLPCFYFKTFHVHFFSGNNGLVPLSRLSHITELDLSENSFSKWSEMLRILDIFPNLTFLNMCKNNFAERSGH